MKNNRDESYLANLMETSQSPEIVVNNEEKYCGNNILLEYKDISNRSDRDLGWKNEKPNLTLISNKNTMEVVEKENELNNLKKSLISCCANAIDIFNKINSDELDDDTLKALVDFNFKINNIVSKPSIMINTSPNEEVSLYCEKIESILENEIDELNEPTKNLLKSHADKIDFLLVAHNSEILTKNQKDSDLRESEPPEDLLQPASTRFDDLGLPLNALEIEVANMVKQKKRSEKIPPYDRHVHETPLKYLEKYYGKYLLCFGAEDDYLYQFQLEAIDSKFLNTLRISLSRHNKDINDYIPTKSVKLDKQALALKENPEIKKLNATDLVHKSNKITSLRMTNRL